MARGKRRPKPMSVPQRMIWDEVDAEISPMTDEQKTRMLQDEDYVDTYTKIQDMVQAEILNLVKGRIEATPEGKELLQKQLKIVKKLKGKIIQETNREILPTSATVADVYVAINSQYHDYAELFKNWFGDGIEQKIVESAIVFWFKDADCKAENKVVEYLGEY